MALKLCPSCRTEYVRTAERCSDCGAALVSAEGFVPPPPEIPADSLPPAALLALVRTGTPGELEGFAGLLQEHGISCRIDSYPPGAPAGAGSAGRGAGLRLGLYVLERDLPAAVGAVEERLLAELPDAVAPGARGELTACPACGASLAAEASGCAECGLEFPAQEQLCRECGGVARAEDLSCPSCNAPLHA